VDDVFTEAMHNRDLTRQSTIYRRAAAYAQQLYAMKVRYKLTIQRRDNEEAGRLRPYVPLIL